MSLIHSKYGTFLTPLDNKFLNQLDSVIKNYNFDYDTSDTSSVKSFEQNLKRLAWAKLSSNVDTNSKYFNDNNNFDANRYKTLFNVIFNSQDITGDNFNANYGGFEALYNHVITETNDSILNTPVPFIENISIETKGEKLSLVQTSIEIICFTEKDLNAIEILYCNPRLSLFLEFGYNTPNVISKIISDVEKREFYNNISKVEDHVLKSNGEYMCLLLRPTKWSYTLQDNKYVVSINYLGANSAKFLDKSLLATNQFNKNEYSFIYTLSDCSNYYKHLKYDKTNINEYSNMNSFINSILNVLFSIGKNNNAGYTDDNNENKQRIDYLKTIHLILTYIVKQINKENSSYSKYEYSSNDFSGMIKWITKCAENYGFVIVTNLMLTNIDSYKMVYSNGDLAQIITIPIKNGTRKIIISDSVKYDKKTYTFTLKNLVENKLFKNNQYTINKNHNLVLNWIYNLNTVYKSIIDTAPSDEIIPSRIWSNDYISNQNYFIRLDYLLDAFNSHMQKDDKLSLNIDLIQHAVKRQNIITSKNYQKIIFYDKDNANLLDFIYDDENYKNNKFTDSYIKLLKTMSSKNTSFNWLSTIWINVYDWFLHNGDILFSTNISWIKILENLMYYIRDNLLAILDLKIIVPDNIINGKQSIYIQNTLEYSLHNNYNNIHNINVLNIPVYGKKSICSNYSITGEISSDLSSQIAYGTAADNTSSTIDNSIGLFWKDIDDKIINLNSQNLEGNTQSSVIDDLSKKIQSWINDNQTFNKPVLLHSLINKLFNDENYNKKFEFTFNYNDMLTNYKWFGKISNELLFRMSWDKLNTQQVLTDIDFLNMLTLNSNFVSLLDNTFIKTVSIASKNTLGKILFPLKINVDMIYGFSGFYYGNLFTVNRLMQKYNENGLFFITSVRHTLSGFNWKTSLTGAFAPGYNLENNNDIYTKNILSYNIQK